MKFCDRLNLYIETLGCSAKTLSAASGISNATISRYRSGEREPGRDSERLLRLAQGICAIAAESDYSPGFSEDEVLCALRAQWLNERLQRVLRRRKRQHRRLNEEVLPGAAPRFHRCLRVSRREHNHRVHACGFQHACH